MNIKQAEKISGVSRQNIRFYEREGLLTPVRNPENDYREYSDGDVQRLKRIRLLRMLDMPLEQIRMLLDGSVTLNQAAAIQEERLTERIGQLSAARGFCAELCQLGDLEQLDTDAMLRRMEEPENRKSLSSDWLEDYRRVVQAESRKAFTFTPDGAVTNPEEFSQALRAYARDCGGELIITKEGMYPEFTLDGIEYSAERFYNHYRGIPVAHIRCQALHPEELEPDVPKKRKTVIKLLNFGLVVLLFFAINSRMFLQLNWGYVFGTWKGRMILLTVLILGGVGIYRFWLFHYNDKN